MRKTPIISFSIQITSQTIVKTVPHTPFILIKLNPPASQYSLEPSHECVVIACIVHRDPSDLIHSRLVIIFVHNGRAYFVGNGETVNDVYECLGEMFTSVTTWHPMKPYEIRLELEGEIFAVWCIL